VEIYEIVLGAQKAALKEIKAGMTGREADAVARDYITEKGYGDEFGHGLGHGIGLQVHEGPRLATKNEDVLVPGMVLTVEPGIYVAGWGGVRIEDNVVIEEAGSRNLTSSTKNLLKLGV
jgi:Xaa-Pro aminopeptidase